MSTNNSHSWVVLEAFNAGRITQQLLQDVKDARNARINATIWLIASGLTFALYALAELWWSCLIWGIGIAIWLWFLRNASRDLRRAKAALDAWFTRWNVEAEDKT